MGAVLLGVGGLGVPCHASITGDPSTDSWILEGSSSSGGNYDDGAGNYNVNIYTTTFTLGGSSPLVSTLGGFDWNAGDVIVGVGGVFNGANSDLTYGGGADENGVSHTGATSTRIVIKYGSSGATWTPGSASTSSPGYASLANGGAGSVLLGTYAYDFYPADSGTLIVPADSPEEQTGASTTATINGDVGRVITDWYSGSEVGFESFLDLTLLDAQYPSTKVAPGNAFVIDLQDGSGAFQDSQATLTTAVPEPGTPALLVVTAGIFLAARSRFRTAIFVRRPMAA